MSTPITSQQVPDDESTYLRAFVGSRADYYLERWKPVLNGFGSSAGFNWAAFLLGGFWLPFRKMYLIASLLFIIILLEVELEEALFVGVIGISEVPRVMDPIVTLAVMLACGAYGNRFYLHHARKVIRNIRAQGLDEASTLKALSKRGGTSVFSIVFVLLLLMVMIVAVATLDI